MSRIYVKVSHKISAIVPMIIHCVARTMKATREVDKWQIGSQNFSYCLYFNSLCCKGDEGHKRGRRTNGWSLTFFPSLSSNGKEGWKFAYETKIYHEQSYVCFCWSWRSRGVNGNKRTVTMHFYSFQCYFPIAVYFLSLLLTTSWLKFRYAIIECMF